MPVAAGVRVGERHDDDVPDARGDLLAAPWAAVGLAGGVGLDRAHLSGPPGERVASEHGAQRSRTGLSRTCHEALSPLAAEVWADGCRFRYNFPMDSFRLGVRFHPALCAGADGDDGLVPGDLLRLAAAAEEAGSEAVLVSGDRVPGAPADPFVLLGALAATTSRVVLGCVATTAGERHPAVLAKTVAALDVCSEGRALACLGAPPDPGGGGLDELAETLRVVRLMLDTPAPSFAGRYFAIEGAWNEPRAGRATPTPLGVLLPAPRGPGPGALPFSPAALATLVARHADLCFVEAGNGDMTILRDVGRALRAIAAPIVALVSAVAGATPGDVASLAERALGAPCWGVVIDWRTAPSTDRVTEVVTAVREVVPLSD